MSVYKLNNVIQTYSWGSIKRSLHEMFNVENPNHIPQAEMWMGAHLRVLSCLDQDISLTIGRQLNHDARKLYRSALWRTSLSA